MKNSLVRLVLNLLSRKSRPGYSGRSELAGLDADVEVRFDEYAIPRIKARSEADAWRVARARFPGDRKGQIAHELAMKASDSSWHRQLSDLALSDSSEPSPYWLFPFQNYKTFCPYLVGSYAAVARELGRYIGLGYRTFLIDIPASEEELAHTGIAFEMARGALPC